MRHPPFFDIHVKFFKTVINRLLQLRLISLFTMKLRLKPAGFTQVKKEALDYLAVLG